MQRDLTKGPITRTLLIFAVPMILGNLLQQLYNIADTLIVGRFLGAGALAAVGSAYTLMTFLTSILLGLCLGSGALVSILFGQKNEEKLKNTVFQSFCLIGSIALLLTLIVFCLMDPILHILQIPSEIYTLMRDYVKIIFIGIVFTFLYNYCACMLRALGNSLAPLLFLLVSALVNIGLDLWFVIGLGWGVSGAATATVIAQGLSGVGIVIYTLLKGKTLLPSRRHASFDRQGFREIFNYSFLTCMQQSVMNLGILMVQGLVNSFGTVVMAAFAAAVKIDSFAYMPVQDFGNAFSSFAAQCYGAKAYDRVKKGIRSAVITAIIFCVTVSVVVWIAARPLLSIFIDSGETAILDVGVSYLRIEGAFYVGIGLLFLLYGLYRAIAKPGMSVVLTVISLGTRVLLAYVLSAVPAIGVIGIWAAIPIGWFLADLFGFIYYHYKKPLRG